MKLLFHFMAAALAASLLFTTVLTLPISFNLPSGQTSDVSTRSPKHRKPTKPLPGKCLEKHGKYCANYRESTEDADRKAKINAAHAAGVEAIPIQQIHPYPGALNHEYKGSSSTEATTSPPKAEVMAESSEPHGTTIKSRRIHPHRPAFFRTGIFGPHKVHNGTHHGTFEFKKGPSRIGVPGRKWRTHNRHN